MVIKKRHIVLGLVIAMSFLSSFVYAQKKQRPEPAEKEIPPLIPPPKTKTLGENPDVRTRILFLLDASGSMGDPWNAKNSESKIESAKKILIELADSLNQYANVEIALRVYGDQFDATEHNCTDSRLVAGFSRSSVGYIKDKLKTIRPKGETPIAYSLQKAGGDFPDAAGRNIIILMTDGGESCGGDPCAVSASLEKKNVVLKHFIIGFELDDITQKLFNCVGVNYNVNDQATFHDVMNTIMSRILNKTTAQVDLLDQNKKPTITNVNMSFYTATHKVLKYDYYHTMNAQGIRDTLALDPVTDYDLVIHTIPPVEKDNIKLEPNHHNIISIPAAQGDLQVLLQGKTIDNNLSDRIKCLVRSKEDSALVYVQDLNSSTRYLCGSYDLELLTLPRTYINVDIKPNNTSTVQIPTPGIANLVKKYEVYGGIFMMRDNRLEKIYEISQDIQAGKTETVALQPGNYMLIYRAKASKNMNTSQTIPFEIRSGESVALNLDVK